MRTKQSNRLNRSALIDWAQCQRYPIYFFFSIGIDTDINTGEAHLYQKLHQSTGSWLMQLVCVASLEAFSKFFFKHQYLTLRSPVGADQGEIG